MRVVSVNIASFTENASPTFGSKVKTGIYKKPQSGRVKVDSSGLEGDVIFSVETAIKYEGYEKRELERIEKIKKLDGLLIPKQINYADISNLSSESKEKLSTVMPETLGQASRISGVRPSDVAVLSIYLTSQK